MRKGNCKLANDNCKLINEVGEQGRLLTTRRHTAFAFHPTVFAFHLEICNYQLSIRNLFLTLKAPLTLALSRPPKRRCPSRGEGTSGELAAREDRP